MKMLVVAFALVALAVAAPPAGPDDVIETVRSNFDQEPDGAYNFGFETKNGIVRQEEGVLKEAVDEDNKPHKVITVRGSYTYTDKDGNQETVNYSADENGYQADGPSIPKLPVAARR